DTIVDGQGRNVYVKINEGGTLAFTGPGRLTNMEMINLTVMSSTDVGRDHVEQMNKSKNYYYPKVEESLVVEKTSNVQNYPGYPKLIRKAIKSGATTADEMNDESNYIVQQGLNYEDRINGKDVTVAVTYSLSVLYGIDPEMAMEKAVKNKSLYMPRSDLENWDYGQAINKKANHLAQDFIDGKIKIIPSPFSESYQGESLLFGVSSTSLHEVSEGMNNTSETKSREIEAVFKAQHKEWEKKTIESAKNAEKNQSSGSSGNE
ncbi:MAG: hypothetical protein JKY54_04130, partial [Flavobacteriales bacterium]|nr:hypothetical protein [Flavobacteriales bacterium]